MAGVGMAGGYGVNGANVMQGVMARVHSGRTGALNKGATPAASVPLAAAPIPDATIPDAAAPRTLSTLPAVTASMPRLAGRKMKL